MNFEESISKIEAAIDYVFQDKSLLKQAFTRPSYCNEKKRANGDVLQSYQVIEFFGDTALSCAIISLFLKKHTKRYANGIKTSFGEGDFSILKSRLEDKKNLSTSIEKLGLEEFLLLGDGDIKQGVKKEASVMEDLFESIIGAIFIDSGENLTAVTKSVLKMLDTAEYLKTPEPPKKNPINALQEWCQDKRHRRPLPIYKTLDEQGPDNQKTFYQGCYIGNELYGRGIGKNQKIANASAAEEALIKLEAEFAAPKSGADDSNLVMQKLREIAKTKKKPSPAFHDLGETEKSTETQREYAIECRFAELTAKACGFSKKDARERAAKMMLELLTKSSEKQKAKSKQSFTKSSNSKAEKKNTNSKAKQQNSTRVSQKKKNEKKEQK